jgi:hypothetical protein
VREPRVRDNSPHPHERVHFSSAILPPYLRRSKPSRSSSPGCTSTGSPQGIFRKPCRRCWESRSKG